METVNDVRDALSARSRTATLEQLASEGRKRVRIIKAEHVAAMISAAVHSAIDQSGLIPREEAEKLVESSRREFRTMLQERQEEVNRVHELEELVESRDREIVLLRQQLDSARVGGGGGGSAGTGAAAGGVAGAPDLSAALEKLAGSLNDRLEKLGKKMGISSAVEAGEVNFDGLFKDTGKELESNMENIQVKKKAGGGIAANLERLKKLKGGG